MQRIDHYLSNLILPFISSILYSNQHTQFRKTVEINRNYCLIFGFTIFIFLTDVPWLLENSQACTAVTFLGHYIWLSAFTWTCMIFIYIIILSLYTLARKNLLCHSNWGAQVSLKINPDE